MLQKYSSYLLCFLIALFVAVLYVNNFGPLVKLEWAIQDMLYSFRGQDNYSSDIILVNIDRETLRTFGDWPWHRDKIADLLAAVGSGGPRTVLLDMLFDANVNEDTLGYTNILAGQMSWIEGLVLPYELSPAEYMTNKVSTPKHLFKSSMQVNNDLGILDEKASLQAHKVFLPAEQLCEYAKGLGFKHTIIDKDRKVRWEPLVMQYEGYYYPSVSLAAAANFLGVPAGSITVRGSEYITMGSKRVPTNSQGQLFINYNKPGRSFIEVSAVDILTEKYKPADLKNKLVIISLTSEYITDYYSTPISSELPAAEKTANVIENIIHTNFVNRLDNSPGRDVLLLIGLGIIFAFILPRVSLMYRLIILVASLFVFANLNFILFNSYKMLFRSLYMGLELFLLLLASPFLDNELLHKLGSLTVGFKADSETPKLPKIELPRSEPIQAKHKARKSSEEVIETVAMEKGEFPKPSERHASVSDTAYEHKVAEPASLAARPPVKIEAMQAIDNKVGAMDASEPHGLQPEIPSREQEASVEIASDSSPIHSLGRYKVLGVLGKGAMGTVYKGIDPAIDRNVALKTIRLDFVNDPTELAELKERLSREAKAAGMLSHPNIVTIYDVGTERKLQYIAMEYLEGQTLEDMIRRKVKFNYRIIAQIIAQICSALDYAHGRGIVHRDIKPANIMVLGDYRVKVMDFGIARVDSSSMTRTGIAMGTPNYISPEQLQGKAVDRRCDIFSLGVVMYEMLVQKRPFRGENLTALIYNIVNAEPEPPTSIDKAIPLLFDRVIEKALKKNPAERYQKASEISAALADFIETFGPKRMASV